MGNALAFAMNVINLMPVVLKGVSGAMEAFTAGKAVVEGMVRDDRDPTPAEWDALNAATAALQSKLHSDDE
jgi:hypothetical protein